MNKNDKNLRVPYALAVHGKEEEKRIVNLLRHRKTIIGEEVKEFEKRCAKHFGTKYGVMVNSGSSANLLAIELLNLKKGTEIITPLLTFATTIAPMIQKGIIPVFTDVEEGSYILNIEQIEKAITKKTKAIFVPLLLGNLPNLKKLKQICKKYKLSLVVDSCDTFAPTFLSKKLGAYSDIITTSFYGSHIITAGGGGGMVLINNKNVFDRARVLRGWGRSSSLFSESEDTNIRFKAKLGKIPYDGKFVFDEMGYNFLPLEISAAFGNAQLDKLSNFSKIRNKNFVELFNFFQTYKKFFILPTQDKNTKTQWLAFPLTLKADKPFSRIQLMKYLEENNIQTRPIFTGNILLQPGFKKIKHKKTVKKFPVTDNVTKNGLLIGCHHGLEKKHLNKIKSIFSNFLNTYK